MKPEPDRQRTDRQVAGQVDAAGSLLRQKVGFVQLEDGLSLSA